MSRKRSLPGSKSPITTVQLANGRWKAGCRIYTLDGGTVRLFRTAQSPDAAVSQLRQTITEKLGAGLQLTANSSLETAGEAWLDAYRLSHPHASPSTLDQYERCIHRTLKDRIAAVHLNELTVPLLEGLLREIRTNHGDWNARMARTVLGMVCQHLVRMGLIDRDFAAATTPIRPAKTEREALSAHDVDVVRRVLIRWESTKRRGVRANLDIRRILDVVLGTSMRPGEVLALRKRDVLVADDQVFVSVNGTMQADGHRKPTPKRARQMRIICLPRFAADIIMAKIQVCADAEDYLFRTRRCTPYQLNNLDRAFRKFRDWAVEQQLFEDLEAPVENVLFSTMRKTVATEIASLGDLELAARLLGHASSETTRRFYIKELPWVDKRTADLLQSAFGYTD